MHRIPRLAACVLAAGALSGLVLTGPALAQDKPQQSFHSLVSNGFTVVGTAFVPGAEQSDKHPVVLVTLQKGTSVAVCTLGLGAYENMGSSDELEDATRCDFRSY
jgi:hypothetical protein